jgi:hypothetical protein
MSITPLYTSAELDTEIAAYKAAVRALATAQSYEMDTGISRTKVTRVDLPDIEKHLEWLQRQRVNNAVGSGPQAIVGRVYRG